MTTKQTKATPSKKTKAEKPAAEKDEVKRETMPDGAYPLTYAQKMHFYTLKFCPQPQVLNIGISLTVQDDLDFDLMRRAIYEAYDRCDSMRLRFHETEDGQVWQYFAPKEQRPIEEFHFAHWKPEDADDKMREWTSVPFERQDSPMNQIILIRMHEGYNGIYLKVDHMTMDSFAIIVFMRDIIEIYCSYKYDYPHPKELGSYEQILKTELAYIGSPAEEKDRLYWKEQIEAPEPIYTDLNGSGLLEQQREQQNNPNLRAATIVSQSVKARLAKFHLEPEPTARMMEYCEKNEVTPVCLFLTSIRTYLSKMNGGEEDITIKSTVSRRGRVSEKRCGGTRIHFFPCRTIISNDNTFLEAAAIMRNEQYKMFRHANFFPIEVLGMRTKHYNHKPGQGYECLSLTYQPATRRNVNTDMQGIKYKSEWYSNGVAAAPLYLTVMHNTLDDGMDFYFEYQEGRTNEQELRDFYYYLCRIMFSAIEHPDWSVKQIIDAV